jgi:hypothetical protein
VTAHRGLQRRPRYPTMPFGPSLALGLVNLSCGPAPSAAPLSAANGSAESDHQRIRANSRGGNSHRQSVPRAVMGEGRQNR